MPPLTKPPPLPAAAQPVLGDHFDAWNSASTGHQRAEGRPVSTIPWRQTRAMKVSHQFKSGGTGGRRIFDGVDRGSGNTVPHNRVDEGDQTRKQKVSVAELLLADRNVGQDVQQRPWDENQNSWKPDEDGQGEKTVKEKGGIFDGLVVFVNGSTYPLVSDHRLKQLLAENGARLSIHLGRRQVTHVILGRPNGSKGDGAGGGLAGGKIEKEIRRVGGCGVKYVGAEWVLESVKAGKRLQEAQFSNLKTAPKGQQSVYSMFKKNA